MSHIIDLIGMKFGRLMVLEKAPSTGGQAEWICRCDCGNIKKVKGGHLRSGAILSCGCLNKEIVSKNKTVNLIGKRFGKLVVQNYAGSQNGRAKWHCICDCGNELDVYSSYLKIGDTKSCGCVMSYRELIIENYLKEHNVKFKKQYTFTDLRGKKYPLRFDFAILNDDESIKCLIEYQGEAHYLNIFKKPEKEYIAALKRDEMKRQYCKRNNIPLIEICKEDAIFKELDKVIC